MELEKLHDYASILKDVFKSKTKTALEIFYNEQNCPELLRNEDYFRYTPPYTAKVEPALTFRGYIHKNEPSTLKLGLKTIPFGEKDFNVLIRWTLAVHKKDTEEYEYLGYSQMNISSQSEVSEISVQSSVIQNLVQENCLLWKWNIEICPVSIGLNKRKSRDALNVSMGHEVKIDKDFDEISKTLSSGAHRENKKMFTSILTSIGECKNKQTKYDDRLQDVEQKVLDIYERLSQILGKYSEKVYLLEELTQQIKLSTNMNPDLQEHAQITSIEEDPCTVGKYHSEKDYLLEESTILTTPLTHRVPENEMKLGLTKILSVEEDVCTVGLKEKIASDTYNLNLNSSMMSCKRKTQTDRKVSERLKTEKKSTDLCFPQDTCGLNVCLKDQTDLADFSSLGDENQDSDSYRFTSDQSKVQSDEVEGPLIGDHETQESEGGEADLHKYLVGCKKIPGHSQFIPVETFTLKYLPQDLQDNDLYEYIKVTADLTVRVDVRMSSPDRPKFWPKTTQPYPFYNMSERRNLRTGSGRVSHVNKFQDGVLQDGDYERTAYTKCWCRKCEGSNSPSKVWWEFDVYTATHVVFDDIEANHTTLRLFYDKDDSPVVSVDKVSVVDVNIEYDKCRLYCVTCDETLGNKLWEMFKHCVNVWRKVYNKYFASRSKHKLIFIVSHPHGCSKQVSVGQWKDRLEVGKYISKFTYTTCTCPGSSGAYVYCLGSSDYWAWSELVHSGSLKAGLNYSGLGCVY